MNQDIFTGKWNQIKGKLKQQWGKLTDDDIASVEGKYDELVGKIQQRYGYEREEAKKHVSKFLDENKWD